MNINETFIRPNCSELLRCIVIYSKIKVKSSDDKDNNMKRENKTNKADGMISLKHET